MTDYRSSFGSFRHDQFLFKDFDDCDESLQGIDPSVEFPDTENEVIKLTSLPFYSPLDMIIPPSKMLEEEGYETLLSASCQTSSFLDRQDIPPNPNNKFQNNYEENDSLHPLKGQTQAESKVTESVQESNYNFLKRNSNGKGKNQYDKNIVGNICSTIIRKMLSPGSLREVTFYCEHYKISPKEFLEYFRSFIRKNARFGTSELYNFFLDRNVKGLQKQEQVKSGFKSVFGLYMTRFLNQQYLLYILSAGKMDNEYKYLDCATNLLYIPRLLRQQYDLISQFHELDRDI